MDGNETQETTWRRGKPMLNYGSENRVTLNSKSVSQEDLKNIEVFMTKGVEEQKEKIEAIQKDASPREKVVIDRAKYFINWLRGRVGLPNIPNKEIELALIPEEKMREFFGPGIFGQYDPGTGSVALKDFGDSLYYAGVLVHELIHKYFELHVTTHNKKSNNIEILGSRSGMTVINFSKNVFPNLQGQVLSELPNFYYQLQWVNEEMASNASMWEKTMREKQQLLDEMGITENQWVQIPHCKDEVRLWSGNFLPGSIDVYKNFDVVFGTPLLYMELASNLTWLINEVNGKPLMQVFLEANINPKKQFDLKSAIDAKLGTGFFHQLKQAKYLDEDNVIKLLAVVQSKIREDLDRNTKKKSD